MRIHADPDPHPRYSLHIFFASAPGISSAKVCSFPHHHHVAAFRIDANPDPDVTAPFREIEVKLFTVGGTALD
jgi:hypothetical protein